MISKPALAALALFAFAGPPALAQAVDEGLPGWMAGSWLMEDGADCEDVLTQLSAVIKALDRTGYAVVASGLQQCLRAGDGPDSVDAKRLEKLFLTLA